MFRLLEAAGGPRAPTLDEVRAMAPTPKATPED